MSWGSVALLLIGCVASAGLPGRLAFRVRKRWLVAVTIAVTYALFLPGVCATAIASTSSGSLGDLDGHTSCRFVYGPVVPELGPLGGSETGGLLQLAAAVLAVTTLLVARRRRRHTDAPG